jgi:hypothetical protein
VGFLELSPDLYEKFIVKLNVNRALDKTSSRDDNFVFVFSRCIDDSSTYGHVQMELVPEREVPIFHDNLKNVQTMEIKDHHFDENELDGKKSVPIGDSIKIIKNKSDFDTKYIAVVSGDRVEYHLLLTKNRGNVGKLEGMPYTSFSPKFDRDVIKYKTKWKIDEIENSERNIKELEGLENVEEIVGKLEQKKLEVENRTASEYLRLSCEENDS